MLPPIIGKVHDATLMREGGTFWSQMVLSFLSLFCLFLKIILFFRFNKEALKKEA